MPPTEAQAKILDKDVSSIGNSNKRKLVYQRQLKIKNELKAADRKRKKREVEILGADAPAPKKPKTIESEAGQHHTTVEAGDEEVAGEEEMDEFAAFYNKEVTPKLCITSCLRPTRRCFDFIRELLFVFPNSFYYPRRGFAVGDIVTQAKEHEYTDLIIINEDHKKINGMTVIHLPEGPTAYFKLSNVVLNKEIPDSGTIRAINKPEVILNRFTTRVGQRCARILGALFHQDPHFQGRRAITFHNQRDFIFFRHHKYVFERVGDAHCENDEVAEELAKEARVRAKLKKLGKTSQKYRDMMRDAPKLLEGETIINKSRVRARIQEVGPQFTMKLKYIQHGTFDKQHGEYEFKFNNDMKTHKKKFLM
jgi:ribosome production factor 1